MLQGIYVQRLQELEAAGLNTAVAHREYEMIVEQLNGLIPDLNLVIDEQTGLINKNSSALLGDIEAWKRTLLPKRSKKSIQMSWRSKEKQKRP